MPRIDDTPIAQETSRRIRRVCCPEVPEWGHTLKVTVAVGYPKSRDLSHMAHRCFEAPSRLPESESFGIRKHEIDLDEGRVVELDALEIHA